MHTGTPVYLFFHGNVACVRYLLQPTSKVLTKAVRLLIQDNTVQVYAFSLSDVSGMFAISPPLVGRAGVVESYKRKSWLRRTAEMIHSYRSHLN
jgi:hypothetical protein